MRSTLVWLVVCIVTGTTVEEALEKGASPSKPTVAYKDITEVEEGLSKKNYLSFTKVNGNWNEDIKANQDQRLDSMFFSMVAMVFAVIAVVYVLIKESGASIIEPNTTD